MNVQINSTGFHPGPHSIDLPASKSISNRLLIIRALTENQFTINNLSSAKDTLTLVSLLNRLKNDQKVENRWDTGPAGTTFRFLSGLLSITKGIHVLTGSERMKERPVGILVNALKELGAEIDYMGKTGFPPLRIRGKKLTGGEIDLDATVSSQFISSLMMIAPSMENGIKINFNSRPVSFPYIKMTAELMHNFGIEITLNDRSVKVYSGKYSGKEITVEPDWSSASYWYEIAALSEEAEIHLQHLSKNSLQSDSEVSQLFEKFGVKTIALPSGLVLSKEKNPSLPEYFEYDFIDCPDIAQTVACTCAGLGITAKLTGLKTLRIKETDRITAMINELQKLHINCISDTNDTLSILPKNFSGISPHSSSLLAPGFIQTYHDHRMALSFAPLALKTSEITIETPEVVEKSYPSYWEDLKKTGFTIKNVN